MRKRLRVRLRARDVTGLAETIGPFLSANGAFLVTDERLATATPVSLQLCFEDGRLALEGIGEVLGQRLGATGEAGLILGLEWTPPSRALLGQILSRPRSEGFQVPAFDASEDPTGPIEFLEEPSPWDAPEDPDLSLLADLAPPEPVRPTPSHPPHAAPPGFTAPAFDEPLGPDATDLLAAPTPPSRVPDRDSPPSPSGLSFDLFDESPEALASGFDEEPLGSIPLDQDGAFDHLDEPEPTTAPAVRPLYNFGPPEPAPGSALLEDEPFVFAEPVPVAAEEVDVDVWADDPSPADAPRLVLGARVPVDDLVSDLSLLPPTRAPSPPRAVPSAPPPPPPAADPDTSELAFGDDVRSRLRANTSTEYAYSADAFAGRRVDRAFVAEASEVTPLAKIELIRHYAPTVRTGDFAAPVLPAKGAALPIPSKKQPPALRPRTGGTIAVDLGAQHTRAAALVGAGGPRVLGLKGGALELPSVVAIADEGNTWVGEAAAAKLAEDPTHAVTRIPRLFACAHASPTLEARALQLGPRVVYADEGEVAIRIGQHTISSEELAALLLQEVAHGASKSIGQPTNRVLLTCPSIYGQRQRVGLTMAGLLAGLHVEAVVSAPLAALYEQVVGGLPEGCYLLIDVGAAITDLAVVEVREGMARTTAVGGDLTLGGLEFDLALLHGMRSTLAAEPALREADLLAVERAKIALIEVEEVEVSLSGESEPHRLSQEQVSAAWAPLLERLTALVAEVLIRAGLNGASLTGAFLLGGQARSSVLQQAVANAVGRPPQVLEGPEPVLYGAARLAAILDSGDPLPVVEALAGTLGVGLSGGGMAPIVPRDRALPAGGAHLHTVDSDADLELYLFQGDQRSVERDEVVAHLKLSEPPGLQRPYQVKLDLLVEAHGDISARAVETRTHLELSLAEVPIPSRRDLLEHHGVAPREPSGRLTRWLKRFRSQPRPE